MIIYACKSMDIGTNNLTKLVNTQKSTNRIKKISEIQPLTKSKR